MKISNSQWEIISVGIFGIIGILASDGLFESCLMVVCINIYTTLWEFRNDFRRK